MDLVKEGDIASFEALVDRFKAVVYSLAYSMLRSREDAEEAAQDCFVKLFRARDQFDSHRSLEPWLLRIAGNTCRDVLRRRRSDRLPVMAGGEGDRLAQFVADPKSLQQGNREATRLAIRHELDQLSEKLRQPLMLKYLNGFTNRQIADTLGISVSNAKVRLARAKDLLLVRLEGSLEAGE